MPVGVGIARSLAAPGGTSVPAAVKPWASVTPLFEPKFLVSEGHEVDNLAFSSFSFSGVRTQVQRRVGTGREKGGCKEPRRDLGLAGLRLGEPSNC